MNKWHFAGLVLVACGTIYLARPNLFRRWFWMRTSIAIRLLSPEAYVAYMRGLGVLLIAGGIASFVYGFVARAP
jgi:hypothetical protein